MAKLRIVIFHVSHNSIILMSLDGQEEAEEVEEDGGNGGKSKGERRGGEGDTASKPTSSEEDVSPLGQRGASQMKEPEGQEEEERDPDVA